MAAQAEASLIKRKINVDKQKLLTTLIENRAKHVAEYNEALANYRAQFVAKVEQAVKDARATLTKEAKKLTDKVTSMTDKEILEQRSCVVLLPHVMIEMPVPVSYEKQYNTIISMFEIEELNTVELSGAEFTCFILDEWDWSVSFKHVTSMYNSLSSAG